MEMEVVMPVPASMDFNFDSACSSPYMTAPSSPQRFGNFFFSAPTSPSRISSSSSSFYRDINNNDQYSSSIASNSSNRVFNVEETANREDDEDFEFNFSGQLERTSLSADELFDDGKIKPLKPPTCSDSVPILLSSCSSSSDKIDLHRESQDKPEDTQKRREHKEQERGRERVSSSSFSSSTSRKGSRSLSPMRVSDIIHEQEDINPSRSQRIISSTTSNNNNNNTTTATTPKSYASSFLSAISFSKSYRKWKLKDLLLFRSASEGRPACSDQLGTKYAVLSKKEATEDVKNSSFRSTESSGSVSRRRGPPVSAHELHYTANRAVAEEMKRKTFLPYKQGLLGCLGFNPGGVHDISRGVGSLTRV